MFAGLAPAETRYTVSDPGQVFLELLCAMVRLGGFRSVLAKVVALAGEAPGLSDEQFRAALVALADRAARRLGDETR
ncbi:MAG: hypothetical protein JO345_20315 [Streptosporangiaceae bacterium]|nr:hypothetical protein [Streptosporangiaceae bacterium]